MKQSKLKSNFRRKTLKNKVHTFKPVRELHILRDAFTTPCTVYIINTLYSLI